VISLQGADPRALARALAALAAGIGAVALANLAAGLYPVSVAELFRLSAGSGGVEEAARFIVRDLRLPRTLVAIGAGAGLGAAGAILQGILRNPLAAPGVVGITQGASLAVVFTLVVIPTAPATILPVAALVGAGAAAASVYLLAWSGIPSPERLILVGIGVAALATALTTVLITLGDLDRVQSALLWMVGSVHARQWGDVGVLLGWLVVLLPLALLATRTLDSLSLGDEVARGLGCRVGRARGSLLALSVALAGSAVSIAGAIGFVGLMAPHLARRLVGPVHGASLPAAALVGALLVVGGDLVGRTVAAPVEIPCGIVTAVVGAPYFGYLLYRGRRR